MELTGVIRKLVEEKIQGTDYFIVDFIVSGNGSKITVLLDGDEAINIAFCAQVSRHVSRTIDEMGEHMDPFTLEVSSPGADQPLKMNRQYPKHIGRDLKVKTTTGETVVGELKEVKEDEIVLEVKEKGKGKKAIIKEQKIPMTQIEESRVVISFK